MDAAAVFVPRCGSALLPSLVLGTFACTGGEATVALEFPNEVARAAVRRIVAGAYDPSTGGTGPERTCSEFLGLAAKGREPGETSRVGDFSCAGEPCPVDWFEGRQILRVPAGRRVVYVRAFASTEMDAPPFLEGCTDRLDSRGAVEERRGIPIAMNLVIPASARMTLLRGHPQVGRPGREASLPLEVRITAGVPRAGGQTYPIPGVPIRFRTASPGLLLVGGEAPDRLDVWSDVEGRASVRARFAAGVSTGEVKAEAEALRAAGGAPAAEVAFVLTAVRGIEFAPAEVPAPSRARWPIAVALGHLDENDEPDLVRLACLGTEAGCRPGVTAEAPLGRSALTVLYDVGRDARPVEVDGTGGVLPADVAIADFMPPVGRAEIAVLYARRADCQSRVCSTGLPCPCPNVARGPCPCEGSEISVFAPEVDRVRHVGRYAVTGSNAVSLTVLRNPDTVPFVGLASAAQGRSFAGQRCAETGGRCIDYLRPECAVRPELCGCPPEERCERGVCVARDKVVDLLYWLPSLPDRGLVNFKGCHQPEVACDNTDWRRWSTCTCHDADRRQNGCLGREGGCNCRVPQRIYIGNDDAPALPFALVGGAFGERRTSVDDPGRAAWHMLVATGSGLQVIAGGGRDGDWKWRGEPLINAPVNRLVGVDLDPEIDAGTQWLDVAWIAFAPCSRGLGFQASCPIVRDNVNARGCLGVYVSEGMGAGISQLQPEAGCRRIPLAFAPADLCSGRFNADPHADLAVSDREQARLLLFLGDGRGGVLDPPDVVSLPSGARGGPLACGDLDADGTDEIVVADGRTAMLYLLRARP